MKGADFKEIFRITVWDHKIMSGIEHRVAVDFMVEMRILFGCPVLQ